MGATHHPGFATSGFYEIVFDGLHSSYDDWFNRKTLLFFACSTPLREHHQTGMINVFSS